MMSLTKRHFAVLALATGLMVGCNKAPADAPATPPVEAPAEPAAQPAAAEAPAAGAAVAEPAGAAPTADPHAGHAEAAGAAAAGATMIVVTQAGASIEPPVKQELIPAGAWFCDMGTVHYARAEKGDGKCPVCKMDLKQKP